MTMSPPVTAGVYQVILVALMTEIQASDFFCENQKVVSIDNTQTGEIFTREVTAVHHGHNLHCKWLIDAESPNMDNVVQISVLESHLQWAPVNAICVGYDYVRVYDGNTTDAKLIITWCGETNPRSVTSTGPYLLIEFITNDRNQYVQRGAHLQFSVFERRLSEGGCPPGWADNPILTNGGKICYGLKTHPETWTQAQRYCNYDQSNLVSIESVEEERFLATMVSTSFEVSEYDKVWISLNDIEVDGQYKWLDGAPITFNNWIDPNHSPESYFNCIQMNKVGKWTEDFCNENDVQSVVKYKFLCKKFKVGATSLYQIPSERNTKGGEKTSSPERTWIIVGVLGACVILAVILTVSLVCYCNKKKAKQQRSPNRSAYYEATSSRDSRSSDAHRPMKRDESPRRNNPHESTRPPPTAPSAPPGDNQPETVVIVVQQPAHPQEPPPSYTESQQASVRS